MLKLKTDERLCKILENHRVRKPSIIDGGNLVGPVEPDACFLAMHESQKTLHWYAPIEPMRHEVKLCRCRIQTKSLWAVRHESWTMSLEPWATNHQAYIRHQEPRLKHQVGEPIKKNSRSMQKHHTQTQNVRTMKEAWNLKTSRILNKVIGKYSNTFEPMRIKKQLFEWVFGKSVASHGGPWMPMETRWY